MNANHSDDTFLVPLESRPPSKAELNRAAAKLRVYEWERFGHTDGANTVGPVRKRATVGLLARFKILVRSIAS